MLNNLKRTIISSNKAFEGVNLWLTDLCIGHFCTNSLGEDEKLWMLSLPLCAEWQLNS